MIVDAANSIHIAAARPAAGFAASGAARPGIDFADFLGQAVSGAAASIQSAEAASIRGIKGVESVARVVESVMEAQRSLQAVIAIRDKAVSAWQEISRMAI